MLWNCVDPGRERHAIRKSQDLVVWKLDLFRPILRLAPHRDDTRKMQLSLSRAALAGAAFMVITAFALLLNEKAIVREFAGDDKGAGKGKTKSK